MMRLLLSGILGGIALFMWGALVWMVFKLPAQVITNLPDEPAVVEVLERTVAQQGVYWFPGMPDESVLATKEEKTAARDAWMEKRTRGPIGKIYIVPQGVDASRPFFMVRGLGVMIASAFVATILLRAAAPTLHSYIGRVAFVTMLGALIAVYADGANWNWWHYPNDYTMIMMIDRIGGWLCAGVVMAALVKVRRPRG